MAVEKVRKPPNRTEKRVAVEVQGDHLERLARCPPNSAIAELVWNALDADASTVSIRVFRNLLGGVEEIVVEDDGTGIASGGKDPETIFKRLGGSWKATARWTGQNRALHGKAGEGRFKAFALGMKVEWKSRTLQNGRLMEFTVSGLRKVPNVHITEPIAVEGKPGTVVTISNLDDELRLDPDRLVEKLTQEFALYLQQYSNVGISVQGCPVDPSAVQTRRAELERIVAAMPDGSEAVVDVSVIEWSTPQNRALFLCDENGFALLEMPPGIQAPGFAFTAYARSAYFRELQDQALLDTGLSPGRELLLDGTKKRLRDYFRARAAEEARGAVERWKADEIYPYSASPSNAVEQVERQVFDIVALNLTDQLPEFDKSDVKQKKLAFRLVKEAIEQNPNSLQTILTEVLGLPKAKQDELAELLRETTLSAIINASKIVTDRLRFLAGLEDLLFDPENKKRLLERKQLHRLLAANTWLFGEEYNLTVDDESLNAALERHVELLGRPPPDAAPVLREDGTEGVLDLMLSRALPLPHHSRREHLVVELKRPKQPVDSKVLQQIKDYAFAVAHDDRFQNTQTTWRFIAVSNEVSPSVEKEATQKNRARGMVYEDDDGKLTVWVYTWSQIIEDARARLEFFRRALDYNASKGSAQEHLRAAYAKYLPTKDAADAADTVAPR